MCARVRLRPFSGKTTLVNALRDAGYRVEVETAEAVIREGLAVGKTVRSCIGAPASVCVCDCDFACKVQRVVAGATLYSQNIPAGTVVCLVSSFFDHYIIRVKL